MGKIIKVNFTGPVEDNVGPNNFLLVEYDVIKETDKSYLIECQKSGKDVKDGEIITPFAKMVISTNAQGKAYISKDKHLAQNYDDAIEISKKILTDRLGTLKNMIRRLEIEKKNSEMFLEILNNDKNILILHNSRGEIVSPDAGNI